MSISLETFTAGRWEKGSGYRYFVPQGINDSWEWKDPRLNRLLETASHRLGELNSFARLVPDIELFIRLHVTKEAVISSRIEGTQTQVDEALLSEEEVHPERKRNWEEVNNYIAALNKAIELSTELPFSSRLIRYTHAVLMQGVRGAHKMPDEFRQSQNWIGGASLLDATFIPPAPHYVGELMSDLEHFIHNEEIHVPTLIKIGIVHYQFETIHPFLDGNGRIGRLLISLLLANEGILEQPLLYISTFFERNRGLYFDKLMAVRQDNQMIQWLMYFLVGISKTAEEAVDTLSKVLTLQVFLEKKIQRDWGRRRESARQFLDYLFQHPIVNVREVEKACDLSFKASNDLIKTFQQAEFLTEITGQERNRLFLFKPYVDLFK